MQPVTLNLIFSSFQKDPASRRVLIVIAVFFTVLLLFCLRICPPGHSRRFLSVVSQEKQRYGSGAGMGADGRAYIINNAAFNSKPFPYQVTYVFRILLGIAVADEKVVVFVPVAANSLFHHIHQAVQGFLPAADLAHSYEVAFVVHMEKGFDACQRAYNGCGLAYSSAPVKVE